MGLCPRIEDARSVQLAAEQVRDFCDLLRHSSCCSLSPSGAAGRRHQLRKLRLVICAASSSQVSVLISNTHHHRSPTVSCYCRLTLKNLCLLLSLSSLQPLSPAPALSAGLLPVSAEPVARNVPKSAPMAMQEPAIIGSEPALAPATRPTAQPPAAALKASSDSRKLDTAASVNAKAPPVAASSSARQIDEIFVAAVAKDWEKGLKEKTGGGFEANFKSPNRSAHLLSQTRIKGR